MTEVCTEGPRRRFRAEFGFATAGVGTPSSQVHPRHHDRSDAPESSAM